MDWNAMAAPWLQREAETDAAHLPVLDEILQRASLRPGQRVLDIGPGAGISLIHAAQAVAPTGRITGVEIAPPFAERARQRVPETVEVLLGDAQELALPPATFDAAISMLGVMFFRDSAAAFANIHRAMKPGAALTFGCWGPPQKNPWFSVAGKVASQVFGPGEPFDPDASGPMRFGDPSAMLGVLSQTGWTPQIQTVDLHLTPIGRPEDIADMQMSIGVAAMRIGRAREAGTLTDAQIDAVRVALTQAYAEMMVDGAVRVPANIHFVHAIA